MVIDSILSIDTFEQKCVVIKGMLQSPLLKYHVHTIGIDPSLINNTIYEKKCLENIKKLYKQAGKCDNQQQLRYILEADMVSTTKGLTDNITISPRTSTPAKKPSAKKPLCVFTNVLDMKKTAYRRVGYAKSKCKAIKFVNTPWSLKKSEKVTKKSTNK